MFAVALGAALGGARPSNLRRKGPSVMYGPTCWSRARRALIATLIVASGFFAVATGQLAFAAPADASEVCGAETFLTVEFTNNSDSPITLKEVPALEGEFCARPPHTIGANEKVSSHPTTPCLSPAPNSRSSMNFRITPR